jgi:four helix bundle protein
MRNFRKLQIWERSYGLGLEIYKLTIGFPKSELFGITSQLRRASVSVSTNIAEGSAKSSNRDYLRFLEIALGSICEVESLTYLSRDLSYLSTDTSGQLIEKIIEVKKMIAVYNSKLKQDL